MKTSTLVTCAATLLASISIASGAETKSAATVTLTGVEARLFYEGTGVLSENIASPATFHAWNSAIGEGDARQPANDLVVTAALASTPAEATVKGPLVISVINEKGRPIAKRKFKTVFFKDGKAAKALFVPDAVCIGKVTIKAVFGAQQRVANVELNCGE